MCKGNNFLDAKKSGVTVDVNVTRIVKYICIASVLIVGIIFGTRCYRDMLKKMEDTK